MKALIQISAVKSNTRYAKKVCLLGIPIVYLREMNVEDEKRYASKTKE